MMGTARRAIAQATAPLRGLPDFLIIGGIRCGTTSMISYLGQHPDIGIASTGEVHYFDWNHDRGPNWYRSWFPVKQGRRGLLGESSPAYLMNPEVPDRVRRLLPEARLIVLLRDPTDRAMSHFSLRRNKGVEPADSLAAALEDEENRRHGSGSHRRSSTRLDCYFDQGCYVAGLRRWFDAFPRDRFLTLASTDLFQRPAETYARTLDFLGAAAFRPDFPVLNSSPRLPIEPDTVESLRSSYRPWNDQLFAETGIRFD